MFIDSDNSDTSGVSNSKELPTIFLDMEFTYIEIAIVSPKQKRKTLISLINYIYCMLGMN